MLGLLNRKNLFNQDIETYKKQVLIFLLSSTSLLTYFFSFLNFYRNLNTLAVIELIIATASIFLIYLTYKTQSNNRIQFYAHLYVHLLFSILLVIFYNKNNSELIYIWLLIIPVISYMVLSLRAGFFITLFYYIIATVIIANNITNNEVNTDKLAYSNIVLCAMVFWWMAYWYEKSNFLIKQKLHKLATLDNLTGLNNRMILNRNFKECINDKNNNHFVCLIAFDLDFFKNINDQFGHDIGDEVLIKFSSILKETTPQNATAYRLGGEEFSVIFPCFQLSDSIEFAENIRKRTQNISIKHEGYLVTLTVSSGIAISPTDTAELGLIMKSADRRLYLAKKQGRNKVVYEE